MICIEKWIGLTIMYELTNESTNLTKMSSSSVFIPKNYIVYSIYSPSMHILMSFTIVKKDWQVNQMELHFYWIRDLITWKGSIEIEHVDSDSKISGVAYNDISKTTIIIFDYDNVTKCTPIKHFLIIADDNRIGTINNLSLCMNNSRVDSLEISENGYIFVLFEGGKLSTFILVRTI